jgi:hypothetical protein
MGVRIFVTIAIFLWSSTALFAQQITEQKKTVAFAFGTVHLHKANGTPITVSMPLGTVFFVYYPTIDWAPTEVLFTS